MNINSIAALIATVLCVVFPTTIHASAERIWQLAGASEMKLGKLHRSALSSNGDVFRGYGRDPIDLTPKAMVWCSTKSPTDRIFMGTGHDGQIYRLDGNKAVHIADTGAVVVTDMIIGPDGHLYVSTIPDAQIFKIETPEAILAGNPIEATPFITLPTDVQHIWALAFDANGILFAGTGPTGKVFAVDRDGKAEIYTDTEEQHILALAVSENRLLAGTSPGAKLLELKSPGEVFTLADFPEQELLAITVMNDRHIAVAANKYITKKKTTKTKSASTQTTSSSQRTSTTSIKNNESSIYRVSPQGAYEAIWSEDKTNILSLASDTNNTVYAGLSKNGTVIAIDTTRTVTKIANLDQRDIMSLIAGDTLELVTTGDAGAAYRMRSNPADSYYLSPILDADGNATWGTATWHGKGRIRVQSRSGNTRTPDKSWSAWGKPVTKGSTPDAPTARYIQFKFDFKPDPDAVLRSFELTYKPQNTRAIITKCHPQSAFSDTTKQSDEGEARISTRSQPSRSSTGNLQEIAITWQVENPDKDRLRYRLYYRPIAKDHWIPIFSEEYVYQNTRYTWSTKTMPTGRYQLKIHADDSLDNYADDVLSDTLLCPPITIDNRPPEVLQMTYKNNTLSGLVRDDYSNIGAIELAINNGNWRPLPAIDGMLDEPEERFRIVIEKELDSGVNVLTVRATDVAGNSATDEIYVTVP